MLHKEEDEGKAASNCQTMKLIPKGKCVQIKNLKNHNLLAK
jgi:hypothetical protein